VDRLLREDAVAPLLAAHGHRFVAGEARALLDARRAAWRRDGLPPTEGADGVEALADALAARCAERLAPSLRPVLNLTGTVLHTNLGRAVLADEAVRHLAAAGAGFGNLEYDLADGGRGERDHLVEGLLCALTGAEAATVVNNNAAAVLLVIAALAHGREVVVSRGELVEIGGAFRMPDVMAAAGATMAEVGTTNRTHAADYERAFGPATALVMKVHTSNYAVQGFTCAVDEATLCAMAHRHGLPVAVDLGSGALVDLSRFGLPREPMPQDALAAGCDVVSFSGDKLLGGPQCGLVVGRRDAIERIRRHPLKRALRVSKLPLAALEATLRLYLQPERLVRDLPTLRWLARPAAEIEARARALQAPFADAVAPDYAVEVVALKSQIGSGALPVESLPSAGLAIAPVPASEPASARRGTGRALERLARALRALEVPVIGRIAEDRLLLDLRCLDDIDRLLALLPSLRSRLTAGAAGVPEAGPASEDEVVDTPPRMQRHPGGRRPAATRRSS
jgi:L-seryl-tRNA(Ser) seleniumtransferase